MFPSYPIHTTWSKQPPTIPSVHNLSEQLNKKFNTLYNGEDIFTARKYAKEIARLLCVFYNCKDPFILSHIYNTM